MAFSKRDWIILLMHGHKVIFDAYRWYPYLITFSKPPGRACYTGSYGKVALSYITSEMSGLNVTSLFRRIGGAHEEVLQYWGRDWNFTSPAWAGFAEVDGVADIGGKVCSLRGYLVPVVDGTFAFSGQSNCSLEERRLMFALVHAESPWYIMEAGREWDKRNETVIPTLAVYDSGGWRLYSNGRIVLYDGDRAVNETRGLLRVEVKYGNFTYPVYFPFHEYRVLRAGKILFRGRMHLYAAGGALISWQAEDFFTWYDVGGSFEIETDGITLLLRRVGKD